MSDDHVASSRVVQTRVDCGTGCEVGERSASGPQYRRRKWRDRREREETKRRPRRDREENERRMGGEEK